MRRIQTPGPKTILTALVLGLSAPVLAACGEEDEVGEEIGEVGDEGAGVVEEGAEEVGEGAAAVEGEVEETQ